MEITKEQMADRLAGTGKIAVRGLSVTQVSFMLQQLRHEELAAVFDAYVPKKLDEIAVQVRQVFETAAALDPDLFGHSLLDLVADNITDVSLHDLQCAIVTAGIYSVANDRIKAQIAGYR